MIRQNNDSGYTLNLDGPEGNAFVLLAAASNLCRQLDYNKDEVMGDLQSGDYNHLLQSFEGYFGSFVTLETNNPDLLKLFA